jgi:hypothetical protein
MPAWVHMARRLRKRPGRSLRIEPAGFSASRRTTQSRVLGPWRRIASFRASSGGVRVFGFFEDEDILGQAHILQPLGLRKRKRRSDWV